VEGPLVLPSPTRNFFWLNYNLPCEVPLMAALSVTPLMVRQGVLLQPPKPLNLPMKQSSFQTCLTTWGIHSFPPDMAHFTCITKLAS
jgi:hypothetical protein